MAMGLECKGMIELKKCVISNVDKKECMHGSSIHFMRVRRVADKENTTESRKIQTKAGGRR